MLVIQTHMFQISKYVKLSVMTDALIEVELPEKRMRLEGEGFEVTYMSLHELRGKGHIQKVVFL